MSKEEFVALFNQAAREVSRRNNEPLWLVEISGGKEMKFVPPPDAANHGRTV